MAIFGADHFHADGFSDCLNAVVDTQFHQGGAEITGGILVLVAQARRRNVMQRISIDLPRRLSPPDFDMYGIPDTPCYDLARSSQPRRASKRYMSTISGIRLDSGTRNARFSQRASYWLGLGMACLAWHNSYALSLSDAVALARSGDPTFLSAQANLAVARERANQAFANVLPQVNASASANANHRVYTTRTTPSTTYDDKFGSHSAQINLTQPLWRSANRAAITQTDAALAQAEYQLAAADQDLLVRLAQAWFDVLSARDQLTFTRDQVSTSQQELDQTARAAALGILGQPSREEARMKYDQSVAERTAAEADLAVKFAALEQIIGPALFPALPALSDQYPLTDLKGDTLERWLSGADSDNPAIRAALSALEAANAEIRKQRAGHEPTVDIVGSYGKNAQGSGTFGGQGGYDSTTGSIGLQFNLPLYSGGGQSAKVREAVALRAKAQQELESARRNARSQGKQAWYGCLANQSRLLAARQTLQYATLNLQSARSGVATGIKTELDVLKGQQQRYGALRDLARARYESTLNYFRLKASVGQLMDEDLVSLDKWLVQAPEQ